MSDKIVKLIPPFSKEDVIRDARRVLQEMYTEGFESVIVFGFKDGKIRTRTSKSVSVLTIVGALDVAKKEYWG